MLHNVSIRNFALIDRIDLELGRGLTVFTGETGAGKSIAFDALSLLLGGRANVEVIRPGADDCTVQAVFSPSSGTGPAVTALLDEAGVRTDDTVLVRRVVSRTGPNRCWINDQVVTAGLMGQVVALLLELVGQHEHLVLQRPDAQRDLIDAFGRLGPQVAAMRAAFAALRDAETALDGVRSAARDRADRLSILRFQLQELQALAPRPGEYEELERRLVRARNASKLADSAATCMNALSEGPDAATDGLRRALEALQRISRLDESFEPFTVRLNEVIVLADDVAADLARAIDAIEDASGIDALETRHEQLRRAMRRFGLDADELPLRAAVITAEIDALEDLDARIAQAERDVESARGGATRAATLLGQAREAAARALFADALPHLAQLGMPHATLGLATADPASRRLTAHGFDGVEVLFSANPGLQPAPLRKVASGGELSRMLLALKASLAAVDAVETCVYDEIDTGIGGTAGRVVARLLQRVGEGRQVLCVTHLAQIAAAADQHLVVTKEVVDGATFSRMAPLDADGRCAEIARMLDGDSTSVTSLEHAARLIGEMRRDAGA